MLWTYRYWMRSWFCGFRMVAPFRPPWLGFHAFYTEHRSSATIGDSSAKAWASTGRIWMKTFRYAACWLRLDEFVFWKGNFALTQVAFIRSLGECQVLSCKMNWSGFCSLASTRTYDSRISWWKLGTA